jgi:hypothetical protein
MTRKSNVAPIRRQIRAIEKALNAESKSTTNAQRAWKLGSAADLLTEVLACELHRMR